MDIMIANKITVYKPMNNVKEYCQKKLTLENPEYEKRLRMGYYVGNIPKQIRLYEKDGTMLRLPYGCLRDLEKLGCKNFAHSFRRPKFVDFRCKIPLYDYQEDAKNAMIKAYFGILQAPAGCGKTQIGLAMAAEIGLKTLWLTHTKDLLQQSKQRAEQYMDANLIGTITEGKVDIGEAITFATIQTMCQLDLAQYKHCWDCIIVDECHRVAGSPTSVTRFYKVLSALASRHKYGLSATVHRSDGMIAAAYALLGDVAYIVPESAVRDKIMPVTICPVDTHLERSNEYLDTDGTLIYARLINYLTTNNDRNKIIIENLITNKEHSCLILSDRLEHLNTLMTLLPESMKEKSALISGKMTSKTGKATREKALEDMRTGEKKYLFATFSLAKEGLDIPRLDRLFLTTPQKDYAVVTQSIGRVARTFAGKSDAVVYDFVDTGIQYLVKSYKARRAIYRKAGCDYLE